MTSPFIVKTPAALPKTSAASSRGQQTRSAILDAALGLASHMGLEGLSIGALAEVVQMSKSGVFAHFGSREELQISVVREYHARFEDEVFFPAMREPRGLPRLRSLFDRWMSRAALELNAGSLFVSSAIEFDDRPGPVRDALAASTLAWHKALERSIELAVSEGHLVDADPAQVVFELQGLHLALHLEARLLQMPLALERVRIAFEAIVERYSPEQLRLEDLIHLQVQDMAGTLRRSRTEIERRLEAGPQVPPIHRVVA